MPERDPSITPVCARCGAEAMIPDAFLNIKQVGAVQIQVGVHSRPDARVLKGAVKVDARVNVCGECGAVELLAEDPDALWRAHVEGLSRSWE